MWRRRLALAAVGALAAVTVPAAAASAVQVGCIEINLVGNSEGCVALTLDGNATSELGVAVSANDGASAGTGLAIGMDDAEAGTGLALGLDGDAAADTGIALSPAGDASCKGQLLCVGVGGNGLSLVLPLLP